MTNALWYVARGTGTVSLVMLSIVVMLGIGSRSGRPVFGLPRFAVSAVHRNASLMAVALLLVHIVTLLLDPYAQLKLVDVVLPFVGAYRPFWLGMGTVAFDLILALVITSLLRHRLGLRGWRAIHWTAYAAWPIAVMHGLGNGTDNGQWWMWTIVAACVGSVMAAIGWRVSDQFAETAHKRLPARTPAAPPVHRSAPASTR
jgi:sulfoxide reductase heme-binding subunit YedZ